MSLLILTLMITQYPTPREKCPNTDFFLVRIFPHSDWIRRDTSYLSVFCPNAEKHGPEKTPYLDSFQVVQKTMFFKDWFRKCEKSCCNQPILSYLLKNYLQQSIIFWVVAEKIAENETYFQISCTTPIFDVSRKITLLWNLVILKQVNYLIFYPCRTLTSSTKYLMLWITTVNKCLLLKMKHLLAGAANDFDVVTFFYHYM